ncbi:cytidylate kinase [Lottiidibacillus patelloidae]|uniref:Cytidylate kinase n=1 Tax=Lottiidibacillus patelloidae TaxID=2670334 RepID=A0A263BU90_9BACI|nr:(d)CMP kinase [Lottiidibacillus patelloidae]OZM57255.1 cytidylate kinase [Lottiidibacillus patelloidae]
MKNNIRIAIDGPAAAGKSTVAKVVAERLSYIYIDTGAMYRALTLKCLNENIDLENELEVTKILPKTSIQLLPSEKGQQVILDNKNVSEEIRTSKVTNNVSLIAKLSSVRDEMVKRQQILAEDGGIVMDGRDIGTHVLPNAEVKIFMLASVEERARRRYEEEISKGYDSNLEVLKEEIAARDKIDSEREFAPLRKASDAIEIDSTHLSIDEVVNRIMEIVRERVGQ